ncbi:MAG: carbohydrate binding family 9 domain-containing protein [Gemmatimonadaceae bacterium]|nr:carbohydrate binding family 9 domain-containing protein [Gemmatimonadaceae bacterium]
MTMTLDRRPAIPSSWLTLAVALMVGASTTKAQIAQVPEPTDATRRHLTARKATGRIVLDGRLSEPDWLAAPVASGFVQVRPDYVLTTDFPTTVRVVFDGEYLYVGAFNRDSAGLASLRMPDLRRDFDSPESDVFGVTFGPLGDRRTALQFQASPLGSQADVQAFDGGDAFSFNWDALWRVRTTRADSGWIAEMAIPWRSLRYAPGLMSWDVNFVRNTRRVAQWSAWVPYPRQFSSWRLTFAGVLDSLQPPPPGTNVRIRPFALGQRSRDATPDAFNGSSGDVGGEVIWAPTANSLVEATINTDFAQADVDRQVVNLSRFNVFFPERRQFFLENADLLSAGGLTGRYVVQPFFSRRIGLADDGTLLPIDGGVRYAYRTGRTTAGALAMRQAAFGGQGATTFGVARGSQFFGRSTRLGATMAMRDGGSASGTVGSTSGQNVVTAFDAFTRLGEQIQVNGMVSTSTAGGRTGLAATYGLGGATPMVTAGITGALVTREYQPQTGFVSRSNVLMTSPYATFTMQPTWRPRSVVWFKHGPTAITYQDPHSWQLQEGSVSYSGELLFRSGASILTAIEQTFQRPTVPITLFPNVTIPAGTHDYFRVGAVLKSDQSASIASTATVLLGGFFDGSLDRVELATRWSPNPYVSMRGSYEVNRLRSLGMRDSSFVTHLAGPELRVFLNPRVQWSAFYQYNTAVERGTLNARFSWEFSPLSYVYIVYNDRQAVQSGTTPTARSLIVKLTWLRQL